MSTAPLTELQLSILEFERQRWAYPGAKETAVRDQFGLSMTRYYQMLNVIIDCPEALAADPLTVKRLQRLREARRRRRSAVAATFAER